MKYSHYLALLAMMLTSCIKDEPQNMECDILEAWVDDGSLARHFYQLTDMRISDVPSGADQLLFTVRQRSSLPAIPVYFNLTPGATITPASGSAQDFSGGPVVYTVTSEDGQWHRTYTVDFREAILPTIGYDFEDFELSANGKYYVWYSQGGEGTKEYIWASGNSWGKTFKKPIAAGNLFLGSFNSQYALTNTLKTTEMGIAYTREPVKVTGYYKYSPGDVFTDKDFHEVSDRTDEASIYSVLYVNHDAEGNEVMLHGDDVLSSPCIVRKAQVETLPATDEWQRFEMVFEGTAPIDAALLANRGYNLAIVFSSSKTGDTFEGAVGSTLYIDKVEISFNNQQTP